MNGRRVAAAGAFVCGLAGAVALVHVPRGRPLADAVASHLGVFCPAKKVTPAAAEELRVRGVSALRGKDKAPARPALGWPLDVGREDNVMLWARNVGVSCTAMQTPTRVLRCADVPGSAFPWGAREGIIDEVAFGFAPDGRLVAVQTLRRADGTAGGAPVRSDRGGSGGAPRAQTTRAGGCRDRGAPGSRAHEHRPPALPLLRLPGDRHGDEPLRPHRPARAIPVGDRRR